LAPFAFALPLARGLTGGFALISTTSARISLSVSFDVAANCEGSQSASPARKLISNGVLPGCVKTMVPSVSG
jgi:hypothetical protein